MTGKKTQRRVGKSTEKMPSGGRAVPEREVRRNGEGMKGNRGRRERDGAYGAESGGGMRRRLIGSAVFFGVLFFSLIS